MATQPSLQTVFDEAVEAAETELDRRIMAAKNMTDLAACHSIFDALKVCQELRAKLVGQPKTSP